MEGSCSGYGDLAFSLSYLSKQSGAPQDATYSPRLADTTLGPFQVCGPKGISSPRKLSHTAWQEG